MKKQKDVTHKTQIFQEAQKTKTLNKKQIHVEPRGEFQKIPKGVLRTPLKKLLKKFFFHIWRIIY